MYEVTPHYVDRRDNEFIRYTYVHIHTYVYEWSNRVKYAWSDEISPTSDVVLIHLCCKTRTAGWQLIRLAGHKELR